MFVHLVLPRPGRLFKLRCSTLQTSHFTRSSPFRDPDIVFNFPSIHLVLVPSQMIPMVLRQFPLLGLRQLLHRLRQLLLHRLRQLLPQAIFEAAANLEEKVIRALCF